MKTLFKTAAFGLLAAAMTGMASAQTIIHICGSTAFRAPVTCAIVHALQNSGTDTCYAAFNKGTSGTPNTGNNNVLGAQSGIFADGTVTYSGSTFTGTASTIVLTNWTGSLAGCLDVAAQNATLTYPNPQDTTVESVMNTSATVTTGFEGGGTLASGFSTTAAAPDVAMSDSFATSAATALSTAQVLAGHNIGGATTGAQLQTLINGAGLVEAGSSSPIVGGGTGAGYLGIVPFEWVLGNLSGATVPFTNITMQTANYLIKSGSAPFTMFSTLKADNSTLNTSADFVYLIGRNEDSGTRIDAFAEPQLGFTRNPHQFLLGFTGTIASTTDIPAPTDFTQIGGTAAMVETMNPWPADAALNTEADLNWSTAGGGHGGYAGGGDVSSVLSTPVDQSGLSGLGFVGENSGKVYFIGYLGMSDAGGFPTLSGGISTGSTGVSGGYALNYDGVPASTANIQNGSYSFWSYEHMYYLGSGSHQIGSAQKTFADSLANSLATTYVDYSSSGMADPTGKAAGVFLLTNDSTGVNSATSTGNVYRAVEGGGYTLNY